MAPPENSTADSITAAIPPVAIASSAAAGSDDTNSHACGVVIIGRNEGERLRRCIASTLSPKRVLVYVDSGSTDGSVAMAQAQGVAVVQLDMSEPFTAARARNAGFEHLNTLGHELPFVQFVDGDCEVMPNWFDAAHKFFSTHVQAAAVCGRLRERHPEQSLYNHLCDLEWQAPAGKSRSVGGNAMLRSTALQASGGYREDLIAGEEPELCVRLRQAGWQIWRLTDEMALHDAAMTRFGQWWKRAVRSGHALAEGASIHGAPPERHNVQEMHRSLMWGVTFPFVITALSLRFHPAFALLALIYPLQVLRLALRDGIHQPIQRWRAFFMLLARFAEVQGIAKFWLNRLFRRRAKLIEYK
jgi:GT2 family glycosyltransferase